MAQEKKEEEGQEEEEEEERGEEEGGTETFLSPRKPQSAERLLGIISSVPLGPPVLDCSTLLTWQHLSQVLVHT